MMDMTLKTAIMISVAIHSIAIAPFCKTPLPKDNKKAKAIEIEYVKISKPAKEDETKKIELNERVDIKPAKNIVGKKAAAKKLPRRATEDPAKKEARLKTKSDYINYYQLIREKIRQRLKQNYRALSREGVVCLAFILRSNGSLVTVDIRKADSTSDRTLLDIAVRSVKEASPFPPFPKALSLDKISFDLAVSFKKES